MPVSSTFSTSAPRSASSSEQKPPGRSRVRSRTLTSLSGRSLTLGDPQQLASLGDAGGTAADVLGHLARLGDQLAVRLRHLAARQVEVVLDTGANVAAQHQRRTEQLPLVARDADDLPLIPALAAAGNLVRHEADVTRRRTDAAVDPHHQRDLQRRALEQAHVDQRVEIGDVARVEALVLGLDPQLLHRGEELDDRVEAVLEDGLEDEVLAPR